MLEINKWVYRMAKDDDLSEVSPSHDPSFLYEWYEWIANYFPRIRGVRDNM